MICIDYEGYQGVKSYQERRGAIMKKYIDVFDYSGEIMKSLNPGVLLTTKSGDKVNTMTIGWGHLGIEWNKPIFVAYVREKRFTRGMLDESMEFTVNVPYGDIDKSILGFCGTKSARDVNKIETLGLTLVESDVVAAPAIKELPLTLECKVLYRQMQDIDAIPVEIREKCYPQNVDGLYHGANEDIHIMYFGEIVRAYIIEG